MAWPRRYGRMNSRRRRQTDDPPGDSDAPRDATYDDLEDESYVAPTGLRSRKRFHEAERIMEHNDAERTGGSMAGGPGGSIVLSVSLFLFLAISQTPSLHSQLPK